MKKPELIILFIFALLVFNPVHSRDSDSNEPIQVEADLLEVDETNNISTYTGKVKLEQGSLKIQSEKLIIRFDDEGELTIMEMTGDPAIFNQIDNDNKTMRGQADRIDYDQLQSTLHLIGEAKFEHDGDLIQSQKIVINTELDTIDAGGEKEGDRVKMLIKPRQE